MVTSSIGEEAPEVGRAATRALELARVLGDRAGELEASAFLYFHYEGGGHFSRLKEIAEAMLRGAEESGDPRLLVAAHYQFANYLTFHTSDFMLAREHYEKALAAYNSTSSPVDLRTRERFANANAFLGWILANLGFLDQAVVACRRAVEFAREQSTAFTVGWTLHLLGWVYRTRGDIEETLATAGALESLVEEYGLTDLHLGWILVARG